MKQLSNVQDYILQSILHHRIVKPVGDAGTVWAGIDFASDIGVIGASHSEALRELYAAIEEWLVLRLAHGEQIPVVEGIDLNAEEGRRLMAWHQSHQQNEAPDQAWFWSAEWQAGEREASQELAQGRSRFFEDDEGFLSSITQTG